MVFLSQSNLSNKVSATNCSGVMGFHRFPLFFQAVEAGSSRVIGSSLAV